jgi:hypothetical protein
VPISTFVKRLLFISDSINCGEFKSLEISDNWELNGIIIS